MATGHVWKIMVLNVITEIERDHIQWAIVGRVLLAVIEYEMTTDLMSI